MPAQPSVRIAVIMAGGSGERFWPLSRRLRPKQLLRLTRADMTLLEESIERIAPLIPRERIFIATSRELVAPIREAQTGVPGNNVIGEPCKRNTAGCLAWAAAHALARFPGQPITMAVLTADHRIDEVESFRATVAATMESAEQQQALATIGVSPTRAETGYGYIETEAVQLPHPGASASSSAPSIFLVRGFREKPDSTTAERFVREGGFFWNSGMFFWPIESFLRELDHASPAHAAATRTMAAALQDGDEQAAEQTFATLPDISIDYALMEKAKQVLMTRANFAWDDVGAWDALDRGWPRDAQGNVVVGDPVLIDVKNSVVYNEPGAERMAVSVIGVEGLAVVVSADGVLIVPKDRVQDVKKAVKEMKARGATQL